jgi:hypothetical protein
MTTVESLKGTVAPANSNLQVLFVWIDRMNDTPG